MPAQKELQPWDSFFSNFKPPKVGHCLTLHPSRPFPNPPRDSQTWSREDVEKRVVTNFYQFRTNYVLLSLGVVVLSLVTSPALIMVLLLCAGMWFYVMVVKPGPIVVGENEYGGLVGRHWFATRHHPNAPPPHCYPAAMPPPDEPKKAIACGGATLVLLMLFGQLLKVGVRSKSGRGEGGS